MAIVKTLADRVDHRPIVADNVGRSALKRTIVLVKRYPVRTLFGANMPQRDTEAVSGLQPIDRKVLLCLGAL